MHNLTEMLHVLGDQTGTKLSCIIVYMYIPDWKWHAYKEGIIMYLHSTGVHLAMV